MSTLFPYQVAHRNRLVDILKTNQIALDTSKTGSGKSITSLHTFQEFERTQPLLQLIIICPPTLVANWKHHCEHECLNSQVRVISSHSLVGIKQARGFLIVDECHEFKNDVKRTRHLKSLIRRMTSCLLMSATPIDDTRQEVHLINLMGSDIEDKMSQMEFRYKMNMSIVIDHFVLSKMAHKLYNQGYDRVRAAARGVEHEHHFEPFVPEFFTKGMKLIHEALFPYLTYYLFTYRNPKKKYIIVLRYKEQFQALKAMFPSLLILNGNVPQKERRENIEKFQTNSEYSLIAVSELVGGIGIELDDIIGDCAREILMLPTSNGVNFTQIIGRIQRTHTKSNSVVRVIQPNKDKTYFKNQMQRKIKVMNRFNQLPKFEHHIHCVCPKFNLLIPDVNRIIQEYACDCMNKK